MKALWGIFRLILRDQRSALLRGAALSLTVLLMGAALLGLSGWFITAAAAAGLAGAGAVFDVFRPSAMVRFLALGRAAARYGERMLTHDATLRALETLRARLLSAYLNVPYGRMIRIRGAQTLNRLTADIDALDGVPLRLVLPVLAGLLALILSCAVLWWLVAPAAALWVTGGYLAGATLVAAVTARFTVPLSRRAEVMAQGFRTRLIDLIRARRDLAVYGRLAAQAGSVVSAEARRQDLQRRLDRAERLAGAGLSILATLVAAGALGIGMRLAESGQIEPAYAALGFFAALALAETLVPLRRAVPDLGRMADAARRVKQDLSHPPVPGSKPAGFFQARSRPGPGAALELEVEKVTLHRTGLSLPVVSELSLSVRPGETVAVTGASGAGKSTLLLAIAGLHPVSGGQVRIGGTPAADWTEADLRRCVTLLPQRSALMAGTVADALRISGPASDEQLWQTLEAVQLDRVIRERGGLSSRTGMRGDGLSGGEARRLVLARALLRNPGVLLLDEPTEGLDEATAWAVLQGVRAILPDAAILIAAHRQSETAFANRLVELRQGSRQ